MKKLIIFCVLFITVFNTSAQKDIVNDPNAELREISGSFNSIKVSGGINLFLSQADDIAVAVSASEQKYKDAIKTEVVNGVLQIFALSDKAWGSWKGNKNLRVYVAFKTLQKIDAAGACDIQVSGVITTPQLAIELSGACDFKGGLAVNELKLNLSGASDVKLTGTANKITIVSSGASDVKSYDLITDYCTAKASGASDINITVNKELYANASGASDIFYKGNAEVKERHTSGASSVEKKS